MKRFILLLGVAAAVASAPASAQYIYIDANNDGVCTGAEAVSDQTTSIDIWLDTDSNQDGSTATCAIDPPTPLNMLSYEFIIHSRGNVTYGPWTNNIASFTTLLDSTFVGNDFHYARGGGGATEVPGLYKLGTLQITVAPGTTPAISLVPASTDFGVWMTSFGSECPGNDMIYSIRLGGEFTGVCGPGAPTPVRTTTWGAIKNMYKK